MWAMITVVIAIFGPHEVDFGRLELRRDGVPVPIEPQVFEVLAYLVEHRDHVVTKAELLDEVWDDRFVTESALTSRIKSARRAVLDDGRAQRVIQTVHGRGYRFVAPVELTDRRADPPSSGMSESPPAERLGRGSRNDLPALDARWPLVGRRDDLAQLQRWLEDPAVGGVLLTGPAGVGKSRLGRELLDLAARAGATTAQVIGHVHSRGVPLAAVAHLLPEGVLETGDAGEDAEQAGVFQRARAALEVMAAEARVVLLVDNADLLDELTTALLVSLVSSGALFAILTQRRNPGEPLVLSELVGSEVVHHLELGALDDTDLDVLLYRVLAGPIDLVSLEQLTALSAGRPGALQELVETCLARRVLAIDEGVWRLVGPVPLTPGHPGPDGVAAPELDGPAQFGLELLALAGDVDLELALDLVGSDALDALDEADLLNVAETSDGPRVSLVHAHLARMVSDGVGRLRARRLKARLAEAIGRAPRNAQDQVRATRWAVETGTAVDRSSVVDAARHAARTGDDATLETLLDHLDATAGGPEAAQLRAELQFRRGQVDLAERTLASVAAHPLDDVTAGRVARWQATILFHARGRYGDAVELLAHRSAELDGTPGREVHAHELGLRAFLGQSTVVLAEGPALLDGLEASAALEMLRALARAHLQAGSARRALELLARHATVLSELGADAPSMGQEQADAIALECLAVLGDLAVAGDLLRERLPVGTRTGLPWLPLAAARVHLAAGQPHAAQELLVIQRAAVGSQEPRHTAPIMLGLVAQAAVQLGMADEATTLADDAASAIPALEGALRWSLTASLAEVWVDLGMEDRAISAVEDCVDAARNAGARLHEAELLAAAGRAGSDVSVRLDELAQSIDGPLWTLRARQLHASSDAEDLEALASDYASLGQRRLARLVVAGA